MNKSLNLMHARLSVRGGGAQQDRMIKDKRETLDRVVLYSYQGAVVSKLESNTEIFIVNWLLCFIKDIILESSLGL